MEDALYEIASMRLFADSALPDRHHHHEFPPARAASTGPSIVQDHQSLAGRSRRHDPRHFGGGCHHH
jgi:IS5 family transposase